MPRLPLPLKTSPQEIARLYLAGHSLGQVAALAKLSIRKIHDILVGLGVPRRPRGAPKGATRDAKLTVRQREQMRADLRSGQFPTLRAIARRYGVSRECARQNAVAAGVTRYTKEARAEAGREHERLRRGARAAAAAARDAVHETQRKTVAALWHGGVLIREIRRILGFRNWSSASTLISEYRKRFPADFPYRSGKKCTSQEARERERAQAARSAARREQIQKRRALLAELWKIGATKAEISSVFGISVPAAKSMLRRHRERYPAKFPFRTPPNHQSG